MRTYCTSIHNPGRGDERSASLRLNERQDWDALELFILQAKKQIMADEPGRETPFLLTDLCKQSNVKFSISVERPSGLRTRSQGLLAGF